MKTFLLAASVLFFTVLLAAPFQASPPRDNAAVVSALKDLGYTAIPLRKTALNEFEVDAKLNGDKSISLLLSFQAVNTIFNTERLDELGVKYQKSGQKFEVNRDKDDLYFVRTDSINVGDGKIGPEELYALEFSEFDAFEDYRVTGILGRDFMIKYNAIVDFADQKLYLKTD